mmetsp:Transcript_44743/g.88373  ORF Transcript_44743/g.88373 Transcript_44743/m.88373 type:complete len:81 (-) Transcript_44743:139-381(-)
MPSIGPLPSVTALSIRVFTPSSIKQEPPDWKELVSVPAFVLSRKERKEKETKPPINVDKHGRRSRQRINAQRPSVHMHAQ